MKTANMQLVPRRKQNSHGLLKKRQASDLKTNLWFQPSKGSDTPTFTLFQRLRISGRKKPATLPTAPSRLDPAFFSETSAKSLGFFRQIIVLPSSHFAKLFRILRNSQNNVILQNLLSLVKFRKFIVHQTSFWKSSTMKNACCWQNLDESCSLFASTCFRSYLKKRKTGPVFPTFIPQRQIQKKTIIYSLNLIND